MNSIEAQNFLQNQTLDVQSANGNFFIVHTCYSAYSNAADLLGKNMNPFFVHYQQPIFTQVMDESRIMDLISGIHEQYLQDKTALTKPIAEMERLEIEFKKIYQEEINLSSYQKFIKGVELIDDWWKYALIEEEKGSIISKIIVPYFMERFDWSKTKADEHVRILATPPELSLLTQERLLFYGLAKLYLVENNSLNFKKLSQDYLSKFFWIKSDFSHYKFFSAERLEAEIKSTIQELDLTGIEKELTNIIDFLNNNVLEQKRLRSDFLFNERDEAELFFAQKVLEWVDIRKRGMMQQFYYLSLWLEEIAPGLNITYDELTTYTFEEIKNAVEKNQFLDKTTLMEREQGSVVVFSNEKTTLLLRDEARIFWQTLQTKIRQGELKGMVASRGPGGKITGTVNVINNPGKEPFAPGSILVTSMTRVEYVPLMKQAMAIITDEGGLACHAAVVSREMGVPCIIATKKATKLLQTGDLVELDLVTGLVHKIS